MIPSELQCKELWEKYNLPEKKRVHVTWVTKVALFLATSLEASHPDIHINMPLLEASALLHDIDKAVERLPGEKHPDTGVRILRDEGMEEVAEVVKRHSLHAILDPTIIPTSWEERLLYLADKMVKQEVLTVDKRFALWRAEALPPDAMRMLDACYPKVKEWERELLGLIHLAPDDVAKHVK